MEEEGDKEEEEGGRADDKQNPTNHVGKLDDALESYYQALAIKYDYAEVHYNLGIALKAQGKMHDAVASYRKAIVIKSDYAAAHNNLSKAGPQAAAVVVAH